MIDPVPAARRLAAVAAVALVGGLAAPAVAAGTSGFEICKTFADEASAEAFASTPFTFTSGETVLATIHGEGCSPLIPTDEGESLPVTERVPDDLTTGVAVTDIASTGGATLSGTDLDGRTTTVTVSGADGIVTFTNAQTEDASLEVCKELAEGSETALGGTTFSFTVEGVVDPVTVVGEGCSTAVSVPAATWLTVTEAAGPYAVTDITATYADLRDVDLAGRTADVRISGDSGIVTFTNQHVPPQPEDGTLKICKNELGPDHEGMTFSYSVEGVADPVVVREGQCSSPMTMAAGDVAVDEDVPAGWQVTAIGSTPTGRVSDVDLAEGSAVATVVANSVTEVNYTNAPVPPQPDGGCTLTQGFWKNHPEAVEQALENGDVMLGSDVLTAEEIEDVLATSGGSNYWYKLAHQLLAAQLNVLASDGGTAPEEVQAAIEAAQQFFATDADGPDKPSDTVTHDGTTWTLSELNAVLTAFNEGEDEGWPHCDG